MNLKKFLSELKRRKVYRVSIAYGFAAWLLAQIAGLISESFEADPWVMKMIIIILISGFPVALILSWIFDIGPEGIERTQALDSEPTDEQEPISVKMVIAGLLLIILIVIGSRWSIREFATADEGDIRSLAILPFDNFTGSDSLEYFVEGMQSSLIGDLQKISALRVPSKTSSNSFKGAKTTIPEIATELKVDAAVEGTITCMGEDSICVQIRLIRAFPEEQQLWVEDYQIEKKEILNFYNKVTKQISQEINVALTPKEDLLLAASRTVNPEAYDAYLKGLYYWEKLDEKSIQKALEFFELASELDPEWADPYAGLANAWGLFSFWGFLPQSVTLPKAYLYLNKALEMDPNSAQAHFTAGILAVWTEWDWEKGEKALLKSIELNPNEALSRMYYAHLLMHLRRTEEASRQAAIGVELDPMKPIVLGLNGVVEQINNGDRKAAEASFRKSLEIDPDFGFSIENLEELLIENAYLAGDYEKWIQLWNQKVSKEGALLESKWNPEARESVLRAFSERGHLAAAEEMLKMNEKFGDECYLAGNVMIFLYLNLNQMDKALEIIEGGYEAKLSGMPYVATRYQFYEQLKDQPRYLAILEKMKLPL